MSELDQIKAKLAEAERLIGVMSETPAMRRAIADATLRDRILAERDRQVAWCSLPPADRAPALRKMSGLLRDRLIAGLKHDVLVTAVRGLSVADREEILRAVATPHERDLVRLALVPADELPVILRVRLAPGCPHPSVTAPSIHWTEPGPRDGRPKRCQLPELTIDNGRGAQTDGVPRPSGTEFLFQREEWLARLERDEPMRGFLAAGLVVATELPEAEVRKYVAEQIRVGSPGAITFPT